MKKFIALALCLALLMGQLAFAEEKSRGEKLYDYLEELAQILKDTHMYAEEDDDPLKQGIIYMLDRYPEMVTTLANMMFQSYDKYSYYIPPQQYETAYATSNANGFGFELEAAYGGICIKNVIRNSPADHFGITSGERVVSIDGVSTRGRSTFELRNFVDMDKKTVSVSLLRQGGVVTFNLTRANLITPTISHRIIDEDIALVDVRMFEFGQGSEEFTNAIVELNVRQIKYIIFDMRGNPGGDTSLAYGMLDWIVPQAGLPLFKLNFKLPEEDIALYSSGAGYDFNKIYILTDHGTASAAELFAGSLQSLGYADIIGDTTYGKARAQTHAPLDDGSYVVVTVGEVVLPNMPDYEGIGIKPDTFVKSMGVGDYPFPDLAPLAFGAVTNASSKETIEQLNQRLYYLGFLMKQPDNIYDAKTAQAVLDFCKEYAIPATDGYTCPDVACGKINTLIAGYMNRKVVVDNVLRYAIDRATHDRDTNVKCTPVAVGDFDFEDRTKVSN